MACARTTDGVMHMQVSGRFREGTNYLDYLIVVSSPDVGSEAYNSLGQLLENLGLQESSDETCPPSTVQMALVNTVEGTISAPIIDHLEEILNLVSDRQEMSKSAKIEM